MRNITFKLNSDNKVTDLENKIQNFNIESNRNILLMAKDSIFEGKKTAESEFREYPLRFRKLLSQSRFLNDVIIERFLQKLGANYKYKDIRVFDCYSMTYFLINNQYLLCFKSLDENKFIMNMKTERVEGVFAGHTKLSRTVVNKLRELGIANPPVLFIGWTVNGYNSITNVHLVNYYGGEINLEINLTDYFAQNIEEEIPVEIKEIKNQEQNQVRRTNNN